MDLKSFKLGKKFYTADGTVWICTDIGSRTIVAAKKTELDFEKDPNTCSEKVFNEYHLNNCSFRPFPKIVCMICKKKYPPAIADMKNKTQGIDCASSIVNKFVYGHYGSRMCDLSRYRFVSIVPKAWRNADPVCDACIKKMVDAGKLVYDGEMEIDAFDD